MSILGHGLFGLLAPTVERTDEIHCLNFLERGRHGHVVSWHSKRISSSLHFYSLAVNSKNVKLIALGRSHGKGYCLILGGLSLVGCHLTILTGINCYVK